MPEDHHAAGMLLRQLRLQRGLSLRQASRLLLTSPAALSRKERGIEVVSRHDVSAAIKAYRLTLWEAYDLWTTAGYLPEPARLPARSVEFCAFAQTLLARIVFPAFILDTLGYMMAWNEGIETIWQPSQAGTSRIHLVADLFAPRNRTRLGVRWEPYVLEALRVFYHRTRFIAHDPAFHALLAELQAQHGAEFGRLWEEAQRRAVGDASLTPIDLNVVTVTYDSPEGLIEYLVLRSMVQLPQPYELHVYVPFGHESEQRYRRLYTLAGSQCVYFGDTAGSLDAPA